MFATKKEIIMFYSKKLWVSILAIVVMGFIANHSVVIAEAENSNVEAAEVINTNEETKAIEASSLKQVKNYTKKEVRLLASLIYSEAGNQPYAGKLAVGIVVKNRMESKIYPNSLKSVVYQKCQFGPARNGALKKYLAVYDAGGFDSKWEKQCIKAAKAALNGEKTVTYKGKTYNMDKFYCFNGSVSGAKITIAGHQFK